MRRPVWDDLAPWARGEAERTLGGGLVPRPALLLFEGNRPTLYVRARQLFFGSGPRDEPWRELFALGHLLRPERACVVYPVRLRTDADGALAGEAEGESAVGVEWAVRGPNGDCEHGGRILPYGLDDSGRASWGESEPLPDGGPMEPPLTAIVSADGRTATTAGTDDAAAGLDLEPAGLAYALTRFGLVVGVDPGWREPYLG